MMNGKHLWCDSLSLLQLNSRVMSSCSVLIEPSTSWSRCKKQNLLKNGCTKNTVSISGHGNAESKYQIMYLATVGSLIQSMTWAKRYSTVSRRRMLTNKRYFLRENQKDAFSFKTHRLTEVNMEARVQMSKLFMIKISSSMECSMLLMAAFWVDSLCLRLLTLVLSLVHTLFMKLMSTKLQQQVLKQ